MEMEASVLTINQLSHFSEIAESFYETQLGFFT